MGCPRSISGILRIMRASECAQTSERAQNGRAVESGDDLVVLD